MRIFSLGWFIIGNWLFFALMFISPFQMGVLESISFAIGMILEIPSGAIADLLGKKKTIQLGLLMQTVGIGMFMLASWSPIFIWVGNIITIGAFAFLSGSLEALVYDSMVEEKKEQFYDYVASRSSAIFPIVSILTALAGGIMWKYNIYLPWIATTIAFLIALIISTKLTEPKVDTFTFSWKQFIKQNQVGLNQLMKPDLLIFIPVLLILLASYHMWNAGIVRIFMGEQFGYDGETLSYLISLVMVFSSVAVILFHKIKKRLGDSTGLLLLSVLSAFGWLVAGLFDNNLWWGFIAFLLLGVIGELSDLWRTTIVNRHVESKYRATSISTMQFFIQIPYAVIAVFFGFLIENNFVKLFYLGTFSLILIVSLTSFIYNKIGSKE